MYLKIISHSRILVVQLLATIIDETGTTFLNTHVSSKPSNKTEGVIGGRILTNINKENIIIIPEGHVVISRVLGKKKGRISAIFDGMGIPFINRPDNAAKTLYNLGTSISAKRGKMEYSLGYDAYLAKKYTAHLGILKLKVNF